MFLELAHTKLDMYTFSRQLVLECYRITRMFPAEEKFTLGLQIRRAALSVHLNIAEGCSRKSTLERKRLFEVSRGSIIEVDAAMDIAKELGFCDTEILAHADSLLIKTFKTLCGVIRSQP